MSGRTGKPAKLSDCYMTLDQIAVQLGVSKERVRQIETEALLKLEHLNPELIKQLRIDFGIAPPKQSAGKRLDELKQRAAERTAKLYAKRKEARA